MTFSVKIDRRAESRMLRGYTPSAVEQELLAAAKEGASAAAKVMRSNAPIGTAKRLSQYYRHKGLSHGTLQRSVRAAAIRTRSSGVSTVVGYVFGPLGPNAFSRRFVEGGTRTGRPANPWVARIASAALSVAQRASESLLEAYARRT